MPVGTKIVGSTTPGKPGGKLSHVLGDAVMSTLPTDRVVKLALIRVQSG